MQDNPINPIKALDLPMKELAGTVDKILAATLENMRQTEARCAQVRHSFEGRAQAVMAEVRALEADAHDIANHGEIVSEAMDKLDGQLRVRSPMPAVKQLTEKPMREGKQPLSVPFGRIEHHAQFAEAIDRFNGSLTNKEDAA